MFIIHNLILTVVIASVVSIIFYEFIQLLKIINDQNNKFKKGFLFDDKCLCYLCFDFLIYRKELFYVQTLLLVA